MDQGLLIQGLELMLFGMTAVGLFLTLLVFAVSLSSRLLSRWFPEPEPEPVSANRSGAPPPGQPAPEVVAAIAAALHQHRSQRH